MKNIILYGAPAAGKGTQSEMLMEQYGYEHISTGQLFRELDDSTEFNRRIHETMKKGLLVDDATTAQLVKNKLQELGNKPVVLDGFPRTLNQAKILDEFFKNYVVININIDEEVALKRTLGRLNCEKCGKIYNKYFDEMKPKKEGMCDTCNIPLFGRGDDNSESFKIRFNTYIDNVKSVLDYYKEKEVLYIVESGNTKDETFKSIRRILEEK